MDNFDKIIKQKAEQFEVPYNKAHWAEMDGRLNSIRAAKIKNNLLGSAAAIVAVAISGYFIFSENEIAIKSSNIIADDTTTEIVLDNEISPKEENITVTNNVISETPVITEVASEENEIVIVEENNSEIKSINDSPIVKEEDNNVVNELNAENYPINAEFIVYNNQVCLGEEVSFESSENDLPVSYTWNFGDGTISHKANPKHVYKESHIYTVTLSLLDRQTGKEYTTIQDDIVNILPVPKANFTYTEVSIKHDDNKLKYPFTTFKIKETNKQNSYTWNYGNGETSTSINGKTIYNKVGNYTATLIVKNNITGCAQITEEKIKVKNGLDLFAPNAFTPNNNGGNETFIPKALLGWDVQFEMTIIDKSSKLVYKTSDKNEPWNGRMNNSGQILNEGIYMWQVVTYDSEGTPHRHHGQINLIK